jgi:hypothetical protein
MANNKKTAKKSNKKEMKTNVNQLFIVDLPRSDIHFKSIADCRRLLSVTVNQIRKNKIDHSKAKILIYAAISMVQIFEKTEIEYRIKEMKAQLDKYEKTQGRR